MDLLVDFTDDASLLDEVGLLRLDLADLLGIDVDVVASEHTSTTILSRIVCGAP